ncbi:hypothetical protein B7463_g3050, partial [Scytalidium lignicola]
MPFYINPSFTKTYHHRPYPAIDPSRPELSARGKTILITGGGKGIGKAIAEAFARAQASTIILIGRTESSLLITKQELEAVHTSLNVLFYVVDCTDAEQIEKTFCEVESNIGAVDILVNNAGYLSDYASIRDTIIDEWWKGFEVNLLGYFQVARSYLRTLRGGREGSIINISSAAAHLRFNGMSSYSGAKNAALWLTDCIIEEEDHVFAVNIHPGVIDTDMNSKNNGIPEDDINLPAYAVVWLASPVARFLRGRTVWSNWDVNELMDQTDEIVEKDLLRMTLRGYPISRGLGYSAE